jgi:6-phosphofructokinase 2
LVKPNQNELSELVGAPVTSEADRIAACRKLVAGGHADMVALTLGEDGSLLVTKDKAWRAQAMRIETVSTVGAGDSFLGGMVAALAKGLPLEEAFRMAVAAGTAAVMSPGTELCHAEDVKRLLQDVKIGAVAYAAA